MSEIPELFGLQEFADFIGWSKNKLSVYQSRGKLPEPITRIKGRKTQRSYWSKEQMEGFKERAILEGIGKPRPKAEQASQ